MWTALQLDRAVMTWGRHVENKMQERDKEGDLINNLEDLLSDEQPVDIPMEELPAWGEPISPELRARLRQRHGLRPVNKAGAKLLDLLAAQETRRA